MGLAPNKPRTLIPWFGRVESACGIYFDQRNRPVGHAGCRMRVWISSDIVNDGLYDAANFTASLHMMACGLNAYDVRIEDARRTRSVVPLLRIFFRFYAQMPSVFTPASYMVPGDAFIGALQMKFMKMKKGGKRLRRGLE